MKTPPFSINNKLILKPYELGQGLKAAVNNGFARVEQKTAVVGLEVLVEARLEDGSFIPKGAVAYIPEDAFTTRTAQWAKDIRKCEALGDQEFIIVDKSVIVLFDTKEEIK